MKSRTYGGPISKKQAKADVNTLVKDTKQELRKIESVSNLTMLDLAEHFVGNLLKRLGFPIDK